MTRYQVLLLPAVAAAILILGGALNPKAPLAQPAIAAATAGPNDPQALEILDQAIAALAPERLPWTEANVWQQIRYEGISFQACGRMFTAPGDRTRFDLNVKVGKSLGELRVVSDGKTLCQWLRIGGDKPVVRCWELPVQSGAITTSTEAAEARTRLLQDQGFAGLAFMLRNVRRRVQGARYQQQRWNGKDVYVIGGVWPEENTAIAAEFMTPHFQLRQCCLYLDAQTLWPHRVEWWGAESPQQTNILLVQTEYRNPVLNQPLSPERCAREFSFSPN
jgi:hypothetical protein